MNLLKDTSVALALPNFGAWFSWVFHISAHPSSPDNPSHATQPRTLFTPPYRAPAPHDLVLLRSAGVRAARGRLQQPRAWRPPPAPVEAKFQSERSPTWPTKSKSNAKGSSEWQGCGIDHVALALLRNMTEQILQWTSLFVPFNLAPAMIPFNMQHINTYPWMTTPNSNHTWHWASCMPRCWEALPALVVRFSGTSNMLSSVAQPNCTSAMSPMVPENAESAPQKPAGFGRRFILWRCNSSTHKTFQPWWGVRVKQAKLLETSSYSQIWTEGNR